MPVENLTLQSLAEQSQGSLQQDDEQRGRTIENNIRNSPLSDLELLHILRNHPGQLGYARQWPEHKFAREIQNFAGTNKLTYRDALAIFLAIAALPRTNMGDMYLGAQDMSAHGTVPQTHETQRLY